ncbi:hypothetical protein ACWIUA_08555, partial [Ursidibacter sp. B-7004-1]
MAKSQVWPDGTDAKDAVNLGQLDKKVNDTKTELNTKIDGAKNELKGDIETAKTELNTKIDGAKNELNTNISNAKTELTEKGLKFKGETGDEIHKNLGDTLEIVGAGNNINTTNTGGKIEISISDTPTFTNITTTNGATISGGDLVMSNQGITGLKSGGDTADNAANIGDVKRIANETAKGLATIVTSDQGSVTVTNTTAANGQKTYNVEVNTTKLAEDVKLKYAGDSGTGENALSTTVNFKGTADEIVTTAKDGEVSFKLADAIKDKINQSADDIATKGLTFTGTEGTTGVKKLGDSVSVLGANDNIKTTADADGVKIELNNTLNLTDAGSVNFGNGNAKLNKDGLTAGDVSVTKDGINAGNKAITNVKAGENDTDAVNLSQLNATKAIAEKGWNVTIAQGAGEATVPTTEEKVAPGETVTYKADKNIKLTQNGKEISISTTDKVNFSEVTSDKTSAGELTATTATVSGATNLNGGVTVNGTTTLNNGATIKGGDLAMSNQKITGLQAGSAETDAVNVKQLNDAITTSGWKLKVNTETDAQAEKVANDEAVTFAQGDNIVITREGKKVTVATSKTPTFDTLKTTGKAEV